MSRREAVARAARLAEPLDHLVQMRVERIGRRDDLPGQVLLVVPHAPERLEPLPEDAQQRRGEQLEVLREVAFVGLEQIDSRCVEKLVLRHRRLGQHQEPVGVDASGA
jgi:hypothetical protein